MFNLTEEKIIFNQGFSLLGGIDEAGRGPLAGPVVAVCVLIDPSFKIVNDKLNMVADSKKLTTKKREELSKILEDEISDIGTGLCDHKTIDRINILQASFLAMKKAIGSLKKKPDFIILDGKFFIPNISVKQRPVVKGDEAIFSVAAASIIAKVKRDKIMFEMHEKYPLYGFDKHKGYGTKLHFESLEKYGPSLIHRKSFAPVKRLIKS